MGAEPVSWAKSCWNSDSEAMLFFGSVKIYSYSLSQFLSVCACALYIFD